jgi:Cof subfamily protein (haloacid dehalogenase superfamily)
VPKFRLIAADLDDTLLNDSIEVSIGNREALVKAMDMGVIVTIATGRMFSSALPVAEKLGIRTPIITYQGALIRDPITKETLWQRPVPLKLAQKVLKEGYRAGLHMNVYVGDSLFVDRITPEGTGYAKLAGVDINPVGNLLDFLKQDPLKILYIADPDVLDRFKRELQDKFGSALYITKSKPQYLEFMHPEATKKHGLEALAQRYGIHREEIMALGDSYNDIDMLEYAGMGVAMGNAPESIKEKADYVSADNNQDGVAKAVEKFILNSDQ